MSKRPVVLIADDNDDVVMLLKTFLRPLDCEFLAARDGEQALAVAQQNLPDVVLLDVMMPRKSGWEVCQALKGVQRTSHIAVCLVTGRGDVKDRLTGLQVGADEYLVKPFNKDEVLKRVKALIARRDVPGGTENALIDRATGLPSVSILLDSLKEMLIEQGEMGIIFADIEQAETTEAEHGWAYFDEFVRRVGEVLVVESKKRHRNARVATHRVGGSSFYIFFETKGHDLTAENALEMASNELRDNLIAALRARFPNMAHGQIGFFVGTTRIDYRPQIRLERQIYHGMQIASDAVRDAEQQRRKQLTRELRDIIRRKRITTVFQPIIRAKDSSIFGYEMLTRGPANSSFINSDMLFSFAREAKLAWALEAIALEGALRKLRAVDLLDRKFLLNLEAEMFEESEFRIHEMVSYFSEHRGHFVFELTERAAIQDYAVFRGLLDEFRQKGIEVAIDDAGSGYASLEAIAALSPDYLKITKGLISALPHESIKQDLVRMLVDLAKKTGAQTLAEGIETEEEYEACKELGIDLMQGYYIAHPHEQILVADAEVAKSMGPPS